MWRKCQMMQMSHLTINIELSSTTMKLEVRHSIFNG